MKVVFIYPHSENINNVEIVGNFNIPEERVKMELDEESGIWMGVIHVRNKKLDDYQINVEENDISNNSENPDKKSDRTSSY